MGEITAVGATPRKAGLRAKNGAVMNAKARVNGSQGKAAMVGVTPGQTVDRARIVLRAKIAGTFKEALRPRHPSHPQSGMKAQRVQ